MSKQIPKKISITYLIIFSAILIFCSGVYFLNIQKNQNKESGEIEEIVTLYEKGERDKAISALENLYKNDKDNFEVAKKLAIYYYQEDKDKYFQFFKNNEIKDATLYNMYATAKLQRGYSKEAEEYYRKAISVNPNNIKYYQNLASLYLSQTKYQDALSILDLGINNNSGATDLFVMAGSVAIRLGQKDRAYQYLSEALKYDSENINAKSLLSKL